MKQALRLALLIFAALGILFQSACQSPSAFVQQQTVTTIEKGWDSKKAIVILAADIREKTRLRDSIPHFGSVYFRRVDGSYSQRGAKDYDFAIQYSLGADWKAAGGGRDENRAPHLFLIEPGMYVIESIEIGSGPRTIYPGYQPITGQVNYGTFEVRAGELVNLGRLVVHMRYYEGIFQQQVADNTDDVLRYLNERYPDINGNLQKKLITTVPNVRFAVR